MFSQTVEYALRAMSLLAARYPSSITTDEIASATHVSPSYLSKVLQALRKARLVHSQRGIGGGVCLAKEPGDITILEVINAVDPIRRITECPIGLAAHGVKLCPMHSRLDEALGMVEDVFRQTTLAEVAEQSASPRACRFPKLKKNG
jgi:Rrf2 family protein